MVHHKPTLRDVAHHAAVSVPTVSKVINGRSDVAEATRDRVIAAIHALGYPARISAAAKSRAAIVDLLISGIGSLWSLAVMQGMAAATARRGLSLVVTSMDPPEFTLRRWMEALVAHRSAGAIVASTRLSSADLANLGPLSVPVVRLDTTSHASAHFAQVGSTNWAGTRDATAHLIDLGHRDIAFIGGPADSAVAHERLEGFTAAMRRAQLPIRPAWVHDGDFMAHQGALAAGTMLDAHVRPTAMVVASDLAALGVYQAIHQRGLRIPHDVSVVGYDDSLLGDHLSPQLTSVRQPFADMAEHAVRIALDAGRGDQRVHPRVELATTLVVRASTSPPQE